MAGWRNIKKGHNETPDEFSYRVTELGIEIELNHKHIPDTFKLGLSCNGYVNLVNIDGIPATRYTQLCL